MVRRGGRFAMVPTGSGEIASGTFRAILRPVCPVVWEGWRREASPYPDLPSGDDIQRWH